MQGEREGAIVRKVFNVQSEQGKEATLSRVGKKTAVNRRGGGELGKK